MAAHLEARYCHCNFHTTLFASLHQGEDTRKVNKFAAMSQTRSKHDCDNSVAPATVYVQLFRRTRTDPRFEDTGLTREIEYFFIF